MEKNLDLLFASRLYKLRRNSELKQPAVAKGLNESQQAYSKLERGETHFSDEIVDAICNYFKITLDDFTQSNDKINCINSPNSATNNHNSQVTTNNAEIFSTLVNELQSMREERKFYMQNIEKLILLIEKRS